MSGENFNPNDYSLNAKMSFERHFEFFFQMSVQRRKFVSKLPEHCRKEFSMVVLLISDYPY